MDDATAPADLRDDESKPTAALPPAEAAVEWFTINAAARRLGVTPTAIRNRIKRGTLETRPNGNHGRLVRVPLTVTVATAPAAEPVTPTVALTVLADHIARLTDEIEVLKGRADKAAGLEAEVAMLQVTAKMLREQIEETRTGRDAWREQAQRLARPAALDESPRRRWWWRRSA